MAYANDIVIYVESWFTMSQQLKRVEAFFKVRGMKLNADKCVSISLEIGGHLSKSAVIIDHILNVNGTLIRSIGETNM